MSYFPRTLREILDSINHDLFLPHIQRSFVWEKAQMEALFDSLMCNYPIQTFLFWRTARRIKVRRFMDCVQWTDVNLHDYYDKAKSTSRETKLLVLDGQQRLQTLYALFVGTQ